MGAQPTRGGKEPRASARPSSSIGRVERAVGEAIIAGRAGRPADPRWKAAESLARSLGRGIDAATANDDPYALAQLGPKLLEVLRELHLTPPQQTAGSSLDALLADLAIPD